MSNGEAVSQIYWPTSLLDMSKRDQSGYVIGFNVNSFVVVVLGVRSVPTLTDARALLSHKLDHPFVAKLTEEIKSPRVLGYLRSGKVNPTNPRPADQSPILDQEADLWLLFDKQTHNNWPVLTEVYCFGFCYRPSPQIVFYEQPKHRTQMVYSTDDLPLFPSGSYVSVEGGTMKKVKEQDNDMELTLKQMQYSWYIEQFQLLEPNDTEKLGNPDDITTGGTFTNFITFIILCISLFRPVLEVLLKFFDIPNNQSPTSSPLSTCNTRSIRISPSKSYSKSERVKSPQQLRNSTAVVSNVGRKKVHPNSPSPSPSASPLIADATTTATSNTSLLSLSNPTPTATAVSSTTTMTTVATTNTTATTPITPTTPTTAPASDTITNATTLPMGIGKPDFIQEDIETFTPAKSNRLIEKIVGEFTSAACYVISLSYTWPSVWARKEFVGLTWIHFYNQVLLLVMDLVLGVVAGIVFSYYHQWFFNSAESAHNWLLYGLQDGTRWLMGQPGGFKLNDQLDLFLGRLFLLYIHNWSALITYLSSFASISMRIATLSGLLGLTTMIAVFIDFVQFLTMHVHWLYKAIAKAFFIQCRAVSSLWLLFRGKKRNVLKQRIDSVDYKADQLLVGTLCFLVLCFLLPTTGVYYLFFLLFRVGTRLVIAAMQTVVIMFTHFPLYYFFLFFSKSPLLSGGIRFELCQNRMMKRSSHSLLYLKLKTNPKYGLGSFFSELVKYLKDVSVRP